MQEVEINRRFTLFYANGAILKFELRVGVKSSTLKPGFMISGETPG